MASGIYNRFKANLCNKIVDLEDDVVKVALYNGTHAFVAGHTVYTVANEVEGAGYTAGGAALAGKAVTEGATTKWDANDVEWTTATFTAHHAVIWGDAGANDLIASIDFGGAKVVADGTFTIQWDDAGLITIA